MILHLLCTAVYLLLWYHGIDVVKVKKLEIIGKTFPFNLNYQTWLLPKGKVKNHLCLLFCTNLWCWKLLIFLNCHCVRRSHMLCLLCLETGMLPYELYVIIHIHFWNLDCSQGGNSCFSFAAKYVPHKGFFNFQFCYVNMGVFACLYGSSSCSCKPKEACLL